MPPRKLEQEVNVFCNGLWELSDSVTVSLMKLVAIVTARTKSGGGEIGITEEGFLPVSL